MSINDNVLNDISDKDAVLDDPNVVAPNKQGSTPPTEVTIISEDGTDKEVTELTPESEEQLASLDATFKVVEDNKEKLISLQQVEKQLEERETVDKSEAEAINDAADGELFPEDDKSLTIEHYTEKPSKVSYSATLTRVKRLIAKTKQALKVAKEEYAECCNDLTKDLIATIKENASKYYRIFASVNSDAKAALQVIYGAKNQTHVINGKNTNLFTLPLKTNTIRYLDSNKNEVDISDAIRAYYSLTYPVYRKGIAYALQRDEDKDKDVQAPFVQTIYDLYASDELLNVIYELEDKLNALDTEVHACDFITEQVEIFRSVFDLISLLSRNVNIFKEVWLPVVLSKTEEENQSKQEILVE
jgi:hypothetical protein